MMDLTSEVTMDFTRLVYLVLAVSFFEGNYLEALKCKTDDGPSDEELKRIARLCMRKLSNNQTDSTLDWDTRGEDNEATNGGRDPFGVRAYEKFQIRSNRHSKRSAWDQNRQQQSENRYADQKNNSNAGQNQGKGNNNRKHQQNLQDRSCVVHCFFEELNMLNKHDYPDKQKVIYVLTRDIRDNELREFYMETIQECFRFLEMEQLDKCQFSKKLINCMADYARSNCEDWHNHTMIFS